MDCGTTSATTSPDISLFQSLLSNVTAPVNRWIVDQTMTTMQAPNDSTLLVKKPWPLLKHPLYAVVLLATAYMFVAITGIVSNSVIVVVIGRKARMRTVINCFLANLAVADILVCVVVLPITLLQNVFTGMRTSLTA